jgi:hypothetical protein
MWKSKRKAHASTEKALPRYNGGRTGSAIASPASLYTYQPRSPFSFCQPISVLHSLNNPAWFFREYPDAGGYEAARHGIGQFFAA